MSSIPFDKYTRQLQSHNPGDVEVAFQPPVRAAPQGMKALTNVAFTRRQLKLANFVGGSRAPGTTRQHSGVINQYFK